MIIRSSPTAKFQLKLTMLIFWNRFVQKGYFQSMKENVNMGFNINIGFFLHTHISSGTGFQFKLSILIIFNQI